MKKMSISVEKIGTSVKKTTFMLLKFGMRLK